MYIPIILGSVRRNRRSVRVARFVRSLLARRSALETELLDLAEFDFPVMVERLRLRDDPPAGLQRFSDAIAKGDAVLVVTPEYNGGYPGALKNALDYLLPEFRRKAVGIVTVSSGGFGGVNCLGQLRAVFLSMSAIPVPAKFPVSRVQNAFSADGTPEYETQVERANKFIDDFLWFGEALRDRRARDE